MKERAVQRRQVWLLPTVVFCLVAVAQLRLVAIAGTDIPFQDQWDAEGRGLYPGLQDGTFQVGQLLRPHNEHRIFWTQLLNLALFRLNGQWDPLVQMAAGAFLHATGVALLAGLLARGQGRGAGWLLAFAVALFGLPLAGWHNALWGFQSQVYFVLLFSLLAFALLEPMIVSPGRMIIGWLAVLAAMMAMGPGMLVPAVLAGGLVLRWRGGRARWGEVWPLAVALLLAGGLWQRVPEHASLQAASAGRFFFALSQVLAWPYANRPVLALILNFPLLLALGGRLLKRRSAVKGEDFVMLLAGWAMAMAVAAAWSRGGGAEFASGVPSRYVDLVALLPLANVWFVVVLTGEGLVRWRTSARLVAVAWGGVLLAGWLGLAAEVWRGLVLPRARDRDAPVRLMQEFQRTDEVTVFAGQPRLLVPHPDLESVRTVLRDPRMQGKLPPSLQPGQPIGPWSRAVRSGLGR